MFCNYLVTLLYVTIGLQIRIICIPPQGWPKARVQIKQFLIPISPYININTLSKLFKFICPLFKIILIFIDYLGIFCYQFVIKFGYLDIDIFGYLWYREGLFGKNDYEGY